MNNKIFRPLKSILNLFWICAISFSAIAYKQEIVNLSPKMRIEDLNTAANNVLIENIKKNLDQIIFCKDLELLSSFPRIAGKLNDELLIKKDDYIYVSGIKTTNALYTIYRAGDKIFDSVTNKLLGQTLYAVANARLDKQGVLSRMQITDIFEHVEDKMIVLPYQELKLPKHFMPQPSKTDHMGRIVGTKNGLVLGRYANVVINLGSEEGIAIGDTLDIVGQDDPNSNNLYKLAQSRGKVLIFKVYGHVSLAVIIDASSPINKMDRVVNLSR